MIHFPPLRMQRLTVHLKELSIGESIAIAAMPPQFEQAECTAFLRAVIEHVEGPEDPADWTVQERLFAVCHYMAAVAPDGPDFSLGEGHYSDYLNVSEEVSFDAAGVPVGEVCGDAWRIRHLTGRMVETVERLQGEMKNAAGEAVPPFFHWTLGCMAAQLVREGETFGPEGMTAGEYDKALLERMNVFMHYPESDFMALLQCFYEAREKLKHLFDIEFSHEGIVVLPTEGAAANLPPAKFPVLSCLAPFARRLVR